MLVFEISRMTNHNGPGIRTLVHFKGCPLRCRWCSTPESQAPRRELGLKASRCINLGHCIETCPQHALSFVKSPGKEIAVDRSACTQCFACTDICSAKALYTIGETWTADTLAKEIRKDEVFFSLSGGGVTFSGGEPLLFVDNEMVSLYRQLHQAGISIGVDTCGFVSWENIFSLLPYIDFFLWDLKLMDAQLHQKYTGFDNALILENLQKINKAYTQYNTDVYIRCVQVPGMTDSEKNLSDICDFIADMECVKAVHLLNYHHFGQKRYEAIGKPYPLKDLESLPDEVLRQKQRFVESRGISCKIG